MWSANRIAEKSIIKDVYSIWLLASVSVYFAV